MKKITAVFLATVYLLSAIGVSVTSFYCCGMLKSTSVSIGYQQPKHNKTANARNCCKTVKQSFKVNDNYFGQDSFSFIAKIFPALHQPLPVFNFDARPVIAVHTAFNSHAPPFTQHKPIYILNCTYLI